MELSILIAKITAVIYLSASLGGFFSRDYYRRLADDMYKNAALTYMMGFMAVIVGFLIVHYLQSLGERLDCSDNYYRLVVPHKRHHHNSLSKIHS